MLGEVDNRSCNSLISTSSVSTTNPPLLSLISTTVQPSSSTLHLSFPSLKTKVDCGMDTMATRQASLVASEQEPEEEQEQELALQTHGLPFDAKKTEIHVIKRRNVGVPKFLRFLYQILEVEDPRIISWSHDGTAFQIIQPEELATQILPRYFKHNKVSSFQRQLNYFGFKKWTKTQTNICTFSHPFFLQSDKDRMKLIKRKERATPVTMSPMTKSSSMELCHQLRLPQHDDFQVHTRTQFPTQQALKRQKSSTLSSASVAFFNSSAAGRRHSTGMLPGSEALNLAAVVAAASLPGRKGTGTPAEQELALEMEARTNAVATATNSHQHFLYLQQLAKAKHMTQQTPFATNTTRRRKSEQLGTEFGLSGKTLATSQMDELMAFSTVPKSDASMVQPVSSACFYQDAAFPVQHEQRQRSRPQMTRHAEYRNFGTKTESWVSTSHNTPNTVYHSQTPESSLLVHSKFSDLNAMPQLQRLGMSQAQIYQQHEERNTWYQQQEQSRHQENRHQVPPQPPARDYIDMLLESAALDENLSLQSSTSISSDAWNESNYAQHSTRATNSAQTFSHHSDQHSQLELPHSFDSRF